MPEKPPNAAEMGRSIFAEERRARNQGVMQVWQSAEIHGSQGWRSGSGWVNSAGSAVWFVGIPGEGNENDQAKGSQI